jgi:Ca2+-binding EF-hand superfamily protein
MEQDQLRVEELIQSFAYNDRDHDGKISLDEFKSMLDELGAYIRDDVARIGFREIDSDHDGAIDVDEFLEWWTTR